MDSIWFRKPTYLEPHELPVDEEYQTFTHIAYKESVKAFYDLLCEKFWLSDYRAIMRANNKLLQLELAYDLGFNVPQTMVTSNPKEANKFRERNGLIVAKSLSFEPIQRDNDVVAFFTTKINPEDEVDFSGLSVAPAIFQKAITNKRDLRITVVGETVHTAEVIPSSSIKDEIDWRVGILQKDKIKYEQYKSLPTEIAQKCVALTKTANLAFGAIDMVIDNQGNYWFLEINPNGQWAFIEDGTDLPIAKSIANLLSE